MYRKFKLSRFPLGGGQRKLLKDSLMRGGSFLDDRNLRRLVPNLVAFHYPQDAMGVSFLRKFVAVLESFDPAMEL